MRVVPCVRETHLVENVLAPAHRPIRRERDRHARIERGGNVGGRSVERDVRRGRPRELHARRLHRLKLVRRERDAMRDRRLRRVQTIRRRRHRAERRELREALRVRSFAAVNEKRIRRLRREPRANAVRRARRWRERRARPNRVLPEPVLRDVDRSRERSEARSRRPRQTDDGRRARDEPFELAPLVDLASQTSGRASIRRVRAPRGLSLRVVREALLHVEHRGVLRIGRPLIVVRVDLRRKPIIAVEDVEQDVVVRVDQPGRDDAVRLHDRRAHGAGIAIARRARAHARDRVADDEHLTDEDRIRRDDRADEHHALRTRLDDVDDIARRGDVARCVRRARVRLIGRPIAASDRKDGQGKSSHRERIAAPPPSHAKHYIGLTYDAIDQISIVLTLSAPHREAKR